MSNFIKNTSSSDEKTEQPTIEKISLSQNAINLLDAHLAGKEVKYIDPLIYEETEDEGLYIPDFHNRLDEYLADEQIEVIENNQRKNLNALLNPQENIFFKEPSKRRVVYPHTVFEQTITKNCNTRSVSCLDTEYQSSMSLQNSINKLDDPNYKKQGDYSSFFEVMREDLKKNHNVEMSDLLRYPSHYRKLIEKSMWKNLDDNLRHKYIGDTPKKFYYNEMYSFSVKDMKMGSPITISTQIKNAFSSSKGEIYLSPQIADLRNNVYNMWDENGGKYPKPIEYKTTEKDCVLLDYWQSKGVDATIERFDEKSDFKKAVENLQTHTITLTTYFGVVDIIKSFQNEELIADLKELVKREDLIHDKRLKEIPFKTKEGKHFTSNIKHYTTGCRLNWILTINGIKYKVKLDIIDLTALHGLTNLNELLINCGIENEYKKSLDDYKSCMFEALLYEPDLYHEYALGDIRLYEALRSYNKNLRGIYNNLGIGEYFQETSLTIGSTVYKMLQSKTYQKAGISADIVESMTEKDKAKFVEDYGLTGSPEYLQRYKPDDQNIRHLFNGNTMGYNRILLGKVDGGRAHCAIPLFCLRSKENVLCDIDISGAYTAKMGNQDYYIGNPTIIVRPTEKQLTLGQHIKKYKKDLGFDNYYMRVSGKLKYEQDLIPSYMDMEKGLKWYKEEIDLDNGETEILNHIKDNLENTKNKILTMEIEDGVITPDILDLILNELSPRHRDDLLDNLKVKAFMFYPLEMEVKTIEEFKEKLALHKKGKYCGRYQKDKECQDNEILNPFHHYIKIPYGEFVVDVIRTFRAKYKLQKKESLNQMFKLIGNTMYGVNVSKYFPLSNVIFANNITAGVRCCIWYAEKALNFIQTITDGGISDLNRVPHPIREKFDTTSFVRAYQSNERELNRNKKYKLKPISKNKKPIFFDKEKQEWLVDERYYDEEGFKNIVAELTLEHIQNCFSKNRLMNAPTRHLITKNIDLASEDIKPKYTIKKGNFAFEVKDFISEAAFTGQTNYTYTSWKGETKTKNRSYETKKNANGEVIKQHTAFFLNREGNLYLDEEFYKYVSPSDMVFNALKKNPEAVPLLPPFAISTIIKTKDWLQTWDKTYKYSKLNFGDTSYKIVIKPLFEISTFKFKTKEQYYSWQKLHDKLKNKCNLTFELFFMNEDGTCNVKKMNETIDKMISNNVINPLKGLPEKNIKGVDPHKNLSKILKNNNIRIYIDCITQARRYHRLSLVGYHKFLYEHYNDHDYLEKAIFEHEIDYYDTDKYSNINEFMHHDIEEI